MYFGADVDPFSCFAGGNQALQPSSPSELRGIAASGIVRPVDQGPEGPGWKDTQIAEAFDCHPTTVENLRRRLVEQGLEAALQHGNRGRYRARKLDGKAEAHLIALTRMEPPEGRNR